jgi:hypothetical protein
LPREMMFFLDIDNGAGFVQFLFQLCIASAQLFRFAALCRLQARLRTPLVVRVRLPCSLATQRAPVTQMRGVKAFSTQQLADLTATATLISLLEDR